MDAASQDTGLQPAVARILEMMVCCEIPIEAHAQHLFRNLLFPGLCYRAGWFVERALGDDDARKQHIIASGSTTNIHREHYARCHAGKIGEMQCAMALRAPIYRRRNQWN